MLCFYPEAVQLGIQKVSLFFFFFYLWKQISKNGFYSKQSNIIPCICNIVPFKHCLCNEKKIWFHEAKMTLVSRGNAGTTCCFLPNKQNWISSSLHYTICILKAGLFCGGSTLTAIPADNIWNGWPYDPVCTDYLQHYQVDTLANMLCKEKSVISAAESSLSPLMETSTQLSVFTAPVAGISAYLCLVYEAVNRFDRRYEVCVFAFLSFRQCMGVCRQCAQLCLSLTMTGHGITDLTPAF